MPDPVFIIRGFSPFGDSVTAGPKMFEDLGAVVDLTESQLEDLRQRLSVATGFLDTKKLTEIVRQSVSDDRAAEAIQRILRNLAPDNVDKMLQSLDQYLEDEDFPLKKSDIDKLKQTLPKLVSNVPALRRFEKAKRLAKLTGQQLETFDLVCDMRPLFDESRTEIEGMIPYTRLHLTVTGENGLPQSFEAELTAQQVNDLAEKAAKAKAKLAVLRSNILEWLPGGIPELPLTRAPRKESNDDS